jgi:hypothetical protein
MAHRDGYMDQPIYWFYPHHFYSVVDVDARVSHKCLKCGLLFL